MQNTKYPKSFIHILRYEMGEVLFDHTEKIKLVLTNLKAGNLKELKRKHYREFYIFLISLKRK